MAYMDENDPDYWDDRRRAQEDVREVIRNERRYDDSGRYDDRRPGDDEDVLEWFLTRGLIALFFAFIASAALYFGAGWLDAQFGWGLVGWLNSWVPEFLRR